MFESYSVQSLEWECYPSAVVQEAYSTAILLTDGTVEISEPAQNFQFLYRVDLAVNIRSNLMYQKKMPISIHISASRFTSKPPTLFKTVNLDQRAMYIVCTNTWRLSQS